jgi:hypothetical protein
MSLSRPKRTRRRETNGVRLKIVVTRSSTVYCFAQRAIPSGRSRRSQQP